MISERELATRACSRSRASVIRIIIVSSIDLVTTISISAKERETLCAVCAAGGESQSACCARCCLRREPQQDRHLQRPRAKRRLPAPRPAAPGAKRKNSHCTRLFSDVGSGSLTLCKGKGYRHHYSKGFRRRVFLLRGEEGGARGRMQGHIYIVWYDILKSRSGRSSIP